MCLSVCLSVCQSVCLLGVGDCLQGYSTRRWVMLHLPDWEFGMICVPEYQITAIYFFYNEGHPRVTDGIRSSQAQVLLYSL